MHAEGLSFVRYFGNDWIFMNNVFKYSKVLKVNETSVFEITFKAIKTGNFTNFVAIYVNDELKDNSSNSTEILLKEDISNVGGSNTSNNTHVGVNNNKCNNESVDAGLDVKSGLINNATGNPLFALLVCLIFLIPFGRKR